MSLPVQLPHRLLFSDVHPSFNHMSKYAAILGKRLVLSTDVEIKHAPHVLITEFTEVSLKKQHFSSLEFQCRAGYWLKKYYNGDTELYSPLC